MSGVSGAARRCGRERERGVVSFDVAAVAAAAAANGVTTSNTQRGGVKSAAAAAARGCPLQE